MEKEPLVTVITVVFNLVKSGRIDNFKQMLKSVQSQTYKNIEHIIIDGASTDGTLEFLKKYQEKGQIKVYSEKDNGPYDAMNKGIKKSNGDYVILLHSDDYFYDKYAIEIQIKYIKMANAEYTIGNTIFINEKEEEVLPYHPIPTYYDKDFKFQKGDYLHMFWIDIPFNHEGVLIKKTVFDKIGYFDKQTVYGVATDFKFEIDLILNDIKYTYIPYNILCFRLGGVSTTPDVEKFCNILKYMYSKFYFLKPNNVIEYDCLRQYPNKLFIYGLKVFMKSLKLKNFNYKKFEEILEVALYKVDETQSITKYYKLLGLPLLKIKTDTAGSKHIKLFNLLPILKVKKDIKGNKTYKLFSFLPIFRIKRKQRGR